jgi:hypothetical protein
VSRMFLKLDFTYLRIKREWYVCIINGMYGNLTNVFRI